MRWLFRCQRGTFFPEIKTQHFSDPRKVNDLLPYVESVLWGGQKVNLDCINAFGEFVIDAFGADVYSELCKYAKVTQEVKNRVSYLTISIAQGLL